MAFLGTAPRSKGAVRRRWPILAPLTLFVIALVLRVVDIFVLRLDEQLGEIIVSKSLGAALIVGYVWWAGVRVGELGLRRRGALVAVGVGAAITMTAFAVAGIVQWTTLAPGDSLVVVATDPKTGMIGGGGFAAFLVFGNVVNAFMEEGLFRGIMLPHFLHRMAFWKANLLQASLFALWHIVWPLKSYLSGEASLGGALAQGGLLMLGTLVAGLVYGYIFWGTGSLWAPWTAHLLNNTILNLVQIQSPSGELQPPTVLSIVVVVALALLALALAASHRWLPLTGLRSWGRRSGDISEADLS